MPPPATRAQKTQRPRLNCGLRRIENLCSGSIHSAHTVPDHAPTIDWYKQEKSIQTCEKK